MASPGDAKDNSIWEQMLLEEKRQRASQRGFKRVSDFEEEESLMKAIQESVATSSQRHEASNVLRAPVDLSQSTCITALHRAEEEEADDMISEIDIGSVDSPLDGSSEVDRLSSGSRWWQLPLEIVDDILRFLGDVDMLGYLRMLSKTPVFPASEKIYKEFCQRIYISQTGNAVAEGAYLRFHSWRSMLIHRPRIRTNGIYSLRTVYSKAPCNDRFWEDKIHEYLETKFYRHFRFLGGGRLLYCLDNVGPDEILKLMVKNKPIPKRVFEGTYKLTKNEIHIEVPTHYCVMYFVLLVMDADLYSGSQKGKHNRLRLIEHSSSPMFANGPWNQRVVFNLPNYADFAFYRYWGLG